ncbi:MAG: LuxR C-terminal-related transcriptional regulator [Ferruginibacter sp.]
MIKRSKLSPVRLEDFSIVSNPSADISNVNARTAFGPVIDQLPKMAVGKYFWFVFNSVTGIIEYAGGLVEEFMGVPLNEFEQQPPVRLLAQAHPEDLPQMFAFTNYWISFVNNLDRSQKSQVHPTIYMRSKNADGIYKWMMVQFVDHLLDASGNITYNLTVCSDISHIKKEGPAMMSILNMADESCQHFFCSDGIALPDTATILPKLSPREIEVLHFLAIGYSSKQIAAALNIAIKTIDNHRQNLLKKTNTKSSGELVAYGINMGFI